MTHHSFLGTWTQDGGKGGTVGHETASHPSTRVRATSRASGPPSRVASAAVVSAEAPAAGAARPVFPAAGRRASAQRGRASTSAKKTNMMGSVSMRARVLNQKVNKYRVFRGHSAVAHL
jgi:hypothetical protein